MKRRLEILKRLCVRPIELRRTLLIILAFGLAGCAPLVPVIHEVPLPSALDLVARFSIDNKAVNRFAARGRLKFKTPQEYYQVEVTAAIVRPDHFRLTTIDFFGRSIFTLTLNQQEFRLLDHRQAKLYRGQASRKILDRFLPMGLDPSEVITLFSGGILLPPHSRARVSRERGGLWCLSLSGLEADFEEERLYIEPLTRQVKRMERIKAGKVLLQVDYSKYHDLNGQKVPYYIYLKAQQQELILEYQEVKLHLDLPNRLFDLPVPPGVKVIDL